MSAGAALGAEVARALDVSQLAVTGRFRGPDVLTAMKGHVLAEAKLTGLYSLNPGVRE